MQTIGVVDVNIRLTHPWGMKQPGVDRDEARALVGADQHQWPSRLKAWREHKGLTRRELGFFADLSDDSIRNYEEGRVIKGQKVKTDPLFFSGVMRIALALGVTVEELTSEDPPTTGKAPKAKARAKKSVA